MKLKLDDAGHAVVSEGRPVYVHEDGKEVPFDAPASVATLNRVLDESKGYKTRAQTAEETAKAFEGIDPVAARRALDTVGNLDKGQLRTAEQVEEIKREARTAAEKQVQDAARASGERIQTLEKQLADINGLYDSEKVTNAFAGSKYLKDKVAWPVDAVQAMFGARFKREEGRLVGYDASGNKLYSRARPGEIADFDEAIEMTIDGYANRDAMLKGSGSTGSGAQPNRGGTGGGKTMTKAAYDALPPQQQAALMSSKDRPQIVE